MSQDINTLRLRRLGIDTQQETVIYMRKDCHVCRSEGFAAPARIRVTRNGHSVIATLNQITSGLLAEGEASLSESAWRLLNAAEGDRIEIAHPRPLASLSRVRGKIYGESLAAPGLADIIGDIVAGRYADIHLASFLTACAARGLNRDETLALTQSMIGAGETLCWDTTPVVDKHCVGGLPGNRTTPIVVAIVTACGLTMPKTSSRAITSPAGTADAMESLAPVDLDLSAMRRVVEREGGCIVWGGAVKLSPADDLLIRIERALDLDSEGQLVASVLSKKAAAGSTHLLLDLPVGPTAKLRSRQAAENLAAQLLDVAAALQITTRVLFSDGSIPVGRGIGPALEARDVLAVLRGDPDAPTDLRDRAVVLSGAVLELAGAVPAGRGEAEAAVVLADRRAWAKFQRICAAQGGQREPPVARYTQPVLAEQEGRLTSIDNRLLATVAKLAGAPDAKAAGLVLHRRSSDRIEVGMPLYTVHAETPGELAYALAFAESNPHIMRLGNDDAPNLGPAISAANSTCR